jgi:MtN3 and saliva related transmembrane protein
MIKAITPGIFGYLAACLTTVAFLPQAIKTIRSRKTDELSLAMYILLCAGVLFWLIYGILIADIPLIIANGVTLSLASVVLFLKIKCG